MSRYLGQPRVRFSAAQQRQRPHTRLTAPGSTWHTGHSAHPTNGRRQRSTQERLQMRNAVVNVYRGVTDCCSWQPVGTSRGCGVLHVSAHIFLKTITRRPVPRPTLRPTILTSTFSSRRWELMEAKRGADCSSRTTAMTSSGKSNNTLTVSNNCQQSGGGRWEQNGDNSHSAVQRYVGSQL